MSRSSCAVSVACQPESRRRLAVARVRLGSAAVQLPCLISLTPSRDLWRHNHHRQCRLLLGLFSVHKSLLFAHNIITRPYQWQLGNMTIHLVETYEEDSHVAVARHIASLLDEGQVCMLSMRSTVAQSWPAWPAYCTDGGAGVLQSSRVVGGSWCMYRIAEPAAKPP